VHAWCTTADSGRLVDLRTCQRVDRDSADARLMLNRRTMDDAIPLTRLLTAYRERATAAAAWDSVRSQLAGRAVLVGGDIDTDKQFTTDGPVPGVAVLARAVEAEIHGTLVKELGGVASIILKLLLGIGIGLLFHYASLGVATVAMIGLVAATSMLGSMPAVFFGYWLNVVPLLLGFWIEHVVEAWTSRSH
jgi:hypothetical protein